MNPKKIQSFSIGLVGLVFLLTLTPSLGHSAIPQKINYQGYLTNAAGVPINGTFQMVFGLYNSPSLPTPLWTEQQSVTVINGIYNVSLGDVTPIPLTFDAPYYLGIQVGADPEMTPRKALTSVGYAFRAMTADVVGAHFHSGGDITSGTVAEPRIDSAIARVSALNAHASNTNNPHSTTAAQVGAVPVNAANSVTSLMISDGTISPVDLGFSYAGSSTKGGPASDLNCPGCVSSGELADAAVTKGKLSATGGTSGQVLGTTDGTSLAWLSPSASVGWVNDGTAVRLATITDNVGIGINVPAAKLHVAGDVRLNTGGIYTTVSTGNDTRLNFYSNTSATDSRSWIELWGDDATRAGELTLAGTYVDMRYGSTKTSAGNVGMRLTGGGDVGMGTTAPTAKLDVNGEVRIRNNNALVFSDANGNRYPDNWIGMVDNIEGTKKWLHIGGIRDSGVGGDNLRRLALFADKTYLNGSVAIGKVTPSERLDVEGNINVSGKITKSYSGATYRITPIAYGTVSPYDEEILTNNFSVNRNCTLNRYEIAIDGETNLYHNHATLVTFMNPNYPVRIAQTSTVGEDLLLIYVKDIWGSTQGICGTYDDHKFHFVVFKP